MKSPLVLRLISLVFPALLSVQAATIPSCISGSLASYIALPSGCSVASADVGSTLFYGFANLSTPASSTAIDPASILISPFGGYFGDAGLQFYIPSESAGPNVSLESVFGFNVLGVTNFDAAILSQYSAGFPFPTFPNMSAVLSSSSVNATVCVNPGNAAPGICPMSTLSFNTLVTSSGAGETNFVERPVHAAQLGVLLDAKLTAGSLGTTASPYFQFIAVPEPATWTLCALVLSLCILLRLKRHCKTRIWECP